MHILLNLLCVLIWYKVVFAFQFYQLSGCGERLCNTLSSCASLEICFAGSVFILLSCEVVCEVYSLSEVVCEVYLLCKVCEVYSHCEVVCEAYCLLTPLVSVYHVLLGTLPSSCTAI